MQEMAFQVLQISDFLQSIPWTRKSVSYGFVAQFVPPPAIFSPWHHHCARQFYQQRNTGVLLKMKRKAVKSGTRDSFFSHFSCAGTVVVSKQKRNRNVTCYGKQHQYEKFQNHPQRNMTRKFHDYLTISSDSTAQLVEQWASVPEGLSSNNTQVNGLSIDVSTVR